jgi:rare lipoprotein A
MPPPCVNKKRAGVLKVTSLVTVVLAFTSLFSSASYATTSGGYFIKASFYTSGTRTASGERFNQDGYTAASRTLPFGTRLQVTNPATGQSVIVRINDRGPYVRGRDLDLARGAAAALGMIEKGTATLKVVRLSRSGSIDL